MHRLGGRGGSKVCLSKQGGGAERALVAGANQRTLHLRADPEPTRRHPAVTAFAVLSFFFVKKKLEEYSGHDLEDNTDLIAR